MNIIRRIGIAALVLALTTVVSGSAFADVPLTCNNIGNVEEFQYSWRLRGGIRFLAGFMFPTNGVGNLRNTYGDKIHSELLITAPNGRQGGFYEYQSDIAGGKTLMTSHGYAWGDKSRTERTIFDYVKGLARIRKQTSDEVENKVKKLPAGEAQFRDILTAIHFLRQNALTLNKPVQTTVYSDGKEYPVIFKPGARKAFTIEGKQTVAQSFEIVDAPGGKKWQGGVTVWLTSDDRRVPVRIEIQQSFASMQLDLKKIESCATLVARLDAPPVR
jgi:hypothetical protein